jgi:L-idonate 5-dehydrogenase
MRAVVIHAARDLRVDDADVPDVGLDEVEVRVGAGGICGSDLHYYLDGGFGAVRVKQPMILGHEVAGVVTKVGSQVTQVQVDDKVAVNPSLPCGRCRYCLAGHPNQCLDMRFYGSAMRMPHVQGAFRETLVCKDSQIVVVPPATDLADAAFAEPLSVCMHAAAQAGPLLGKTVLVSGAGPIGALEVLVARHAGAREIVVTDLMDEPLKVARSIGADRTVNVRTNEHDLDEYTADKGHFDVVFEASGSRAAVATALSVARPGAVIVQIGLGGDVQVPVNTLVAKEINWRGTFRFHEEFGWAVDAIVHHRIDVRPLLTERVPLDDAARAFDLAADRSKSMKVQLVL